MSGGAIPAVQSVFTPFVIVFLRLSASLAVYSIDDARGVKAPKTFEAEPYTNVAVIVFFELL